MSNDAHDERGRFASKGGAAAAADAAKHKSNVSTAKAETIAKFKRVDETHYPTRTGTDKASATDLGTPTGTSATVRLEIAKRLDPKINAHLNEIMRSAASPVPRSQPSAGQMVAAKLITPQ